MVIARSAVSRSRSSLIDSVAWCTRKLIGTTGWSVMIEISTPAAASLPGLDSERLRNSTFERVVNSGPINTGMPLAANRSAIRCASVPWSITSR